ncbi:MAG: hypothetical protein ACRCWF_00505, partial [Beijerinckiaceae bacterium]
MRIFQSIQSITPHALGFDAHLEHGWTLRVRAMSDALLRVVLEPAEGLPLDRSWMVAPEGDVPWEGRNREDMAGFIPPLIVLKQEATKTVLSAGQFR